MVPIEKLARIAEIEFSDIVDTTELIGIKLRIMLIKEGFVDVWLSRKLADRFGYHWEERSTGLSYRYDNFPDTKWKHVSTYPYHFHDGSQDNVVEASQIAPSSSRVVVSPPLPSSPERLAMEGRR